MAIKNLDCSDINVETDIDVHRFTLWNNLPAADEQYFDVSAEKRIVDVKSENRIFDVKE